MRELWLAPSARRRPRRPPAAAGGDAGASSPAIHGVPFLFPATADLPARWAHAPCSRGRRHATAARQEHLTGSAPNPSLLVFMPCVCSIVYSSESAGFLAPAGAGAGEPKPDGEAAPEAKPEGGSAAAVEGHDDQQAAAERLMSELGV